MPAHYLDFTFAIESSTASASINPRSDITILAEKLQILVRRLPALTRWQVFLFQQMDVVTRLLGMCCGFLAPAIYGTSHGSSALTVWSKRKPLELSRIKTLGYNHCLQAIVSD